MFADKKSRLDDAMRQAVYLNRHKSRDARSGRKNLILRFSIEHKQFPFPKRSLPKRSRVSKTFATQKKSEALCFNRMLLLV